MSKVSKLLEEELRRNLDALKTLAPGTTEYNRVAEATENVFKLYNEEIHKGRDEVLKIMKIGTDVVITAGSFAFYGVWMKRGIKFEETGSLNSQTFRGMTQLFKPKR